QRRRQPARRGGEPELGNRRTSAPAKLVIEHDAHALARAGIPDGAVVDLVARIFEDQALGANLYPFGLIGALRDMRPLALLGIDRRDGAVVALDEIDLGDDAERLRGERDRAGGEVGPVTDLIGGRQLATA